MPIPLTHTNIAIHRHRETKSNPQTDLCSVSELKHTLLTIWRNLPSSPSFRCGWAHAKPHLDWVYVVLCVCVCNTPCPMWTLDCGCVWDWMGEFIHSLCLIPFLAKSTKDKQFPNHDQQQTQTGNDDMRRETPYHVCMCVEMWVWFRSNIVWRCIPSTTAKNREPVSHSLLCLLCTAPHNNTRPKQAHDETNRTLFLGAVFKYPKAIRRRRRQQRKERVYELSQYWVCRAKGVWSRTLPQQQRKYKYTSFPTLVHIGATCLLPACLPETIELWVCDDLVNRRGCNISLLRHRDRLVFRLAI